MRHDQDLMRRVEKKIRLASAYGADRFDVVDGINLRGDLYRQARSRELRRRLLASERARRLPIQIDAVEDHEAPDAPSTLTDMASLVRELFA